MYTDNATMWMVEWVPSSMAFWSAKNYVKRMNAYAVTPILINNKILSTRVTRFLYLSRNLLISVKTTDCLSLMNPSLIFTSYTLSSLVTCVERTFRDVLFHFFVRKRL